MIIKTPTVKKCQITLITLVIYLIIQDDSMILHYKIFIMVNYHMIFQQILVGKLVFTLITEVIHLSLYANLFTS